MPYKPEYRAEVLAALRELLAGEPDVTRGQMMGHPVFYYSPSGGKRRMFASVHGPGLTLKLPPELVAELLEDPRFAPFTPMGRQMRGWVVVPVSGSALGAEVEELLRQALAYVQQL